MSHNWTWEQCVREVSCAARPQTCGNLAALWRTVAGGLDQLAKDLADRGSGATGPGGQSLTTMVAGWSGTGGAAYRDHVGDLGARCRQLAADATQLSSTYERLERYLTTATEGIPVPVRSPGGGLLRAGLLMLPGSTRIDPGRTDDATFRARLLADQRKSPDSYADGAFMKLADEVNSTIQKSGGHWNKTPTNKAQGDLAAWYSACTTSAVAAAATLSKSMVDESPSFRITGTSAAASSADLDVGTAVVADPDRSGSSLAGAGRAGLSGLGGLGGVAGIGMVDGALGVGGLPGTSVDAVPGLVASPLGRGGVPLTAPAAVVQAATKPNTAAMLGCLGGAGPVGAVGEAGGGGEEDWLYEAEVWRVENHASPAVIDASTGAGRPQAVPPASDVT